MLFQDEWPRLLHEREAVVMELILHSDVLIPLYAILLILILNALFHGINTLRGVRRIRARLRRGEQPIPRPRRYPEPLHNLVDWSLLGALVLYLGCLGCRVPCARKPSLDRRNGPSLTLPWRRSSCLLYTSPSPRD